MEKNRLEPTEKLFATADAFADAVALEFANFEEFLELIRTAADLASPDQLQEIITVLAIESEARQLSKEMQEYWQRRSGDRFRIRYYDQDTGSLGQWMARAKNSIDARALYESEGPGKLPIVEIKNLEATNE